MSGTTTTAKFVSQKISKIRWKRTPGHLITKSNVFATGSWDDNENSVRVWTVGETQQEAREDNWDIQPQGEPSLLCHLHHPGSVTDLQFLNHDLILVSSSLGGVSLLKHHTNSQTLSVLAEWKSLHHFPCGGSLQSVCPCTGLSAKGEEEFVTVGEDGRICLMSMEHRAPTRTIEQGDSCTINDVCYLKQNEIATVNASGQLKVWDIRDSQGPPQPARLFLPSSSTGERSALHCVDKHPTQPHIVATGGQDGALSVWDMRQDKFPVTVLSAHSADMWEVRFHPTAPDNLFTCSEDGAVWHWNASKLNTGNPMALTGSKDMSRTGDISTSLLNPASSVKTSQSQASSPWLACQASRNQLDITDLLTGNPMPINSLDIVDNTLLCACDAEQVICVQNLVIT